MKVTPLDIQQQQFRVRFRGFDMAEVDNFLDLLANEFEELLKEANQLRDEDQRKTARIHELEAAEKDMRETLISLKKFFEDVKQSARREGELIVEEAKQTAQKIVDNAQGQALKIEGEINQLKRQREEFEASLQATIEMHRKLLESLKNI
jgi:cell division initiation protein